MAERWGRVQPGWGPAALAFVDGWVGGYRESTPSAADPATPVCAEVLRHSGLVWQELPCLWELVTFAHAGAFQGQLESTTNSTLKQVYNLGASQYIEERLLPAYRAREQRAVKNNFPFSSHDNRHCLHNFGEYFDFGMGRRKAEPERQQQNSQNFQLWAHEAVPSDKDDLTIYQTSFVKNQKAEGPFYRRYPKHHSEKWCSGKHAPESEKKVQPNKSP
ncbi:testis-expressed protein 36 [Indicator indicator]|uniref:testis-expressed protein 36 n=1 Tax=Indicator indicator TaxID=1002788 RepID=UPI0023DF4636|nr:testis-expressed protein 36 [Indicator indicator]